METKKESQIEEFVKAVDSLSQTLLNDKKGYVLFAYSELDEKSMESSFASCGKLNQLAECLYTCMKQNPMLANVVIAASNAIVQSRIMETQMKGEGPATPEEAKNISKRKSKKVVS